MESVIAVTSGLLSGYVPGGGTRRRRGVCGGRDRRFADWLG